MCQTTQTHQNIQNQVTREMISTAPVLSVMTRWKRAGNQYMQARSQSTLELVNPDRIEIRQKFSHLLAEWGYGLVGVALIILAMYLSGTEDVKGNGFFLMVFVVVGLWMIYEAVKLQFKKYPTFDKKMGWFWLGKNDATSISQLQNTEKRERLKKIVAVQMIGVSIYNSSSLSWLQRLHLYELNIVFDDLERVNIQCHANTAEMRDNGRAIAQFLGVPFY